MEDLKSVLDSKILMDTGVILNDDTRETEAILGLVVGMWHFAFS